MNSAPRKRLANYAIFLGIALLPIVILGYGAVRRPGGIERVFAPGPNRAGHAQLACAECHRTPWRNARRALGDDTATRSEMDRACARCHGGLRDEPFQLPDMRVLAGLMIRPPAVGHHRQELPEKAHCASCHQEHQAARHGTRGGDKSCVSCHQDLQTVDGTHKFARQVTAFDAEHHPPFGRWRGKNGLVDRPGLHFGHDAHMRLVDAADLKGIEQPMRRLRQQGCAFCHVPEGDGRHMQPIRFARHCAECHPLTFELAEFKPAVKASTSASSRRHIVPHGLPPEDLRRLLGGRLFASALRADTAPDPDDADERPPSLPGRPRTIAPPRETLAWMKSQLGSIERALFQGAGGCRYCHVEKSPAPASVADLPVYEPTRLCPPQLPHARFHHGKHEWMSCTQCHQAPSSSRAGDVLTPTLSQCVSCHTSAPGPARRARADCVECHAYHGASGKPRAEP